MNVMPPDTDADKTVIRTGTAMDCLCPHCASSLVEGEYVCFTVENVEGQRGSLRISQLLNVFDCTVHLPEGVLVRDLACPSCARSLTDTDIRCEECGSRAARLHAQIAGEKVDFFVCLKKGCHWHGISRELRSRMILEVAGFHERDRPAVLIRTGTKLQCVCPWCNAGLVVGEDLVVHLEDPAGHVGVLKLSPYLNVFRSECSLTMVRGQQAKDLRCPHCSNSMLEEGRPCMLCGGNLAKFLVHTSGADVPFHICVRRSCHWHGLGDAAQRVILEDE